MAWMDGRSRAAGTGKAASCGSGGVGGVAYEARGYKQGWADGRAGKTCKPTAQIKPKSNRAWLVEFICAIQKNSYVCMYVCITRTSIYDY